tara:strand:+ start:626 stop:1498 length:873 start_codon:yes stop_codon:yes gene_type:complete
MEDKPKKPKVKKPRKPRVGQKQKQTQIVTVNVSTQDKPKPKRKPRAKPKPKTAPPSASFGLPSTFGGAGGLTAGQPFRQVIYAPSQDVRTSIQSLEKSIATLSQAGGSQRGGDEPPLFAVGDIRDQSFKSKSRSSEESFSDETQTQMGDDDDYQRSSLSGAEPQLKKAGLKASRKPGHSNLSPVDEEDDDEPRVARGQRESTIAGLPTQEQAAQLKSQLADKAKRKKAGKSRVLIDEQTGEVYTPTLSRSEVTRRLDREAAISREQRLRTELAEETPEPLGEQGGGMVFA